MQRTAGNKTDTPACCQTAAPRPIRRRPVHLLLPCWLAGIIGTALLLGSVGCGTNIEEVLFQSGAAIGRTYVDLLLTDWANTLADQADQQDEQPGDGDGADDGDDGGGGDAGGNFDDLVGDPAAGEPLYASCGGCHCADGSGNCLPGAGPVIGASAEALDEYLRGSAGHVPSDLSDQEIVDLEAYLASLGG